MKDLLAVIRGVQVPCNTSYEMVSPAKFISVFLTCLVRPRSEYEAIL
jgi:hypothetical protein